MEVTQKVYNRGDGVVFLGRNKQFVDLSSFAESSKKNAYATLFSRGRRTRAFVTDDSRLYITALQHEALKRGGAIGWSIIALDSLQRRIISDKVPQASVIRKLIEHYRQKRSEIIEAFEYPALRLTPRRVWNLSVVGALILGMVSMSLIYRYLGQGASAEIEQSLAQNQAVNQQLSEGKVLGESIVKKNQEESEDLGESTLISNAELDTELVAQFIAKEIDVEQSAFEREVREMVAGYPIEKMIPEIVKQDRTVAAFLIGIAKKESNWGRRVPVLNGQDCYNYWGYKQQRARMGSGGHTCFDSRQDAVETVGKRIEWLVKNAERDTPAEMIIWKCGSTCAGHSSYSVSKWISDVALYFEKLNK